MLAADQNTLLFSRRRILVGERECMNEGGIVACLSSDGSTPSNQLSTRGRCRPTPSVGGLGVPYRMSSPMCSNRPLMASHTNALGGIGTWLVGEREAAHRGRRPTLFRVSGPVGRDGESPGTGDRHPPPDPDPTALPTTGATTVTKTRQRGSTYCGTWSATLSLLFPC